MSLQVVLNTVSGNPCSSVPVVVTSRGNNLQFKRASSVRCFTDGRQLASLKHSTPTSHFLASSKWFYLPRRTLQLRNRSTRLETRALQAVTADGDSSNGDGVGSSNHAFNLSSVLSSPDALRPFMVSSLHGLQEGIKSLKERGLQSSKEGFEKASSRLKSAEGKSLSVNVRWSEFLAQGARTWQGQEPWIKWPLAIFAGAFLGVLVSWGTVVALDLIPLWIIGPTILGSTIRITYVLADLIHKGFASTQPLREAVMRGAMQLFEDAKRGELFDKLRLMIEQKNLEIKEAAAKKWSDFFLYVKSGQAATDFKAFLFLLFAHLKDWSTDKYEDYKEWVRPYWRAFTRLMKRLF